MERHSCLQLRMVRERLGLLCALASDLPEQYATLRAALGELAADWDALPGPCSPISNPNTPGTTDTQAAGLCSGCQTPLAPAPDTDTARARSIGRMSCPLEAQGIFQTMLDHSHAQLAYLDPQFNFLAVNAAYARGCGYTREELIGKNHFDLFPHAENQAIFTQARDSGETVAFTAKPFVFPNRPELGTTYWDWILVPIKQAGGAVCGLVLSLTDVTPREVARQALAESEQRYRLLVDTMAEGLASLDMHGSITFVNDEFCRMLGYSRDELIGRHYLEVVQAQQHQQHRDAFAERISGQPGTFETMLARRDGSGLPVILAGRPLRDREGNIYGTLAAFTDISDRRAAEEEVQSIARFPSENPHPVLRASRDGVVLYANEASRGLLALWATQVGHPLPDVWRDLAMDVLRTNGPRTIETLCGETVYSVDLVPVAGGSYINLYASDITAQARAQAALRVARDELEERVQERTRELEAANRALEALSQSERHQRLAAEGLLETTLTLNSSLNLDQVLDRILAQTQRAVLCAAVAVIPTAEEPTHIARQRGLTVPLQNSEILHAFLPRETACSAGAVTDPPGTVLITDTQERNAPLPAGLEWVRSYVATPLQVEQAMVGTLCAFSDQPDFFGQEALHLLEGFAAHAATAIHNAELYEAAVRAQHIAESLAAASTEFAQTLDLESVINTLLNYLHRLIPYDGAAVALRQDSSHLAVRAVHGQACPMDARAILDVDSCPQMRALLKTPQAVLIGDTRAHPEWKCYAGASNVISWLGVPMIANDQVIGVCNLCRVEGEPFTQEHVRVAEALVGQAAVAIQNAWLFGQVRAGQERLQALSRRLVEVQEDERRYIARELHDEAAQALISIKMGLSLLERQAELDAPVRSRLNDLNRALDGILENLSRLINHLRPASLDYLGLAPALRQYIQKVSDQHQLTVAYEVLGMDERLSPDVEAAVYRIVQEALGNVVRHAHATRVDVLLERRDDKLIVLVEDNGVGFDVLAAEDSRSLGLAGMRERAEMLGGAFIVESSPGAGTTILVEVPYGCADTHRG